MSNRVVNEVSWFLDVCGSQQPQKSQEYYQQSQSQQISFNDQISLVKGVLREVALFDFGLVSAIAVFKILKLLCYDTSTHAIINGIRGILMFLFVGVWWLHEKAKSDHHHRHTFATVLALFVIV